MHGQAFAFLAILCVLCVEIKGTGKTFDRRARFGVFKFTPLWEFGDKEKEGFGPGRTPAPPPATKTERDRNHEKMVGWFVGGRLVRVERMGKYG